MKRLTNQQKINLIIDDLQAWSESGGDESDDSLLYALRNGYTLHAASLWLGTGAMSEAVEKQVQGVRISRAAEMREINQICAEAAIYICPSCNHHAFLDFDEGESIECFNCAETAHLQSKQKRGVK